MALHLMVGLACPARPLGGCAALGEQLCTERGQAVVRDTRNVAMLRTLLGAHGSAP